MKRIISAGIIGGALALATIGGTLAAPPARQAPAAAVLERPGQGVATAARKGAVAALVKATVDVTGLTAAQVRDELKAGKSLEQIAQSKGKTSQQVIDSARAAIKARLDKAVTGGKLTQVQEDTLLKAFDTAAPKIMQDTSLAKQAGRAAARQHPLAAALIKATADVTGLTPAQVRDELKAGKSLTQVATEHGKTKADVLAKLKENLSARQQKALDAAGGLLDQPGLGAPKDSTTDPAAGSDL